MAVELRDLAFVMPKHDVVTVDHFEGAFYCSFVVGADDVDRFDAGPSRPTRYA
jgi:hypothetical protein